MRYFLHILLILLASCKGQIEYPDGGYSYPKNIDDKDTILYHYQVKDSVSKREAFSNAYEYIIYEAFDERNLSIKPLQKATFRLCYATGRDQTVIINVNEDSIIVKEGDPTLAYQFSSTSLTETEDFHLQILGRYYPIDTANTDIPGRKHYLDSLVKLYPQLLDKDYYHKIFEKTIEFTREKFSYKRTRLTITKKQFATLVAQINASGYWALPRNIECDDPSADGDGFKLEANTPTKYKSVGATSCPTNVSVFPSLCQAIIKLAKFDKKIELDRKWEAVPVE